MVPRMQRRNEKFFTRISKAGSNVVENAGILIEFVAAPHERWAEFAKRLHDTEHAGDHSQQHVPGPVGSETMMSLPHRLPRAEPLGKITPRHPGATTDNDPLDHLAMITPRTRPPLRLRHQPLDPGSRYLAELC